MAEMKGKSREDYIQYYKNINKKKPTDSIPIPLSDSFLHYFLAMKGSSKVETVPKKEPKEINQKKMSHKEGNLKEGNLKEGNLKEGNLKEGNLKEVNLIKDSFVKYFLALRG